MKLTPLLEALNEEPHFFFLNGNPSEYSTDEYQLICGAADEVSSDLADAAFGFVAIPYDYKNEILGTTSNNPSLNGFDKPIVLKPKSFLAATPIEGDGFGNLPIPTSGVDDKQPLQKISFQATTSKEAYLAKLKKIQAHLQHGDIYEINLCIGFYAEEVDIDPIQTYLHLNRLSPTPFSALVKSDDNYLICASPERYLKKSENRLSSNPIKGTIKRSSDPDQDQLLKYTLATSEKDIAENVMVVDMVRNDLSRVATKNSVQVDELCEIYSFPKVHQMISEVSCEPKDLTFKEIIDATFPMASMTGTPKIKALELIEKYENQKRGLFSGSVGFMDNAGDFDMNVVIRSLFYDAKAKRLSFQVGGAITIKSDPENEYSECMLKAAAIFEMFS